MAKLFFIVVMMMFSSNVWAATPWQEFLDSMPSRDQVHHTSLSSSELAVLSGAAPGLFDAITSGDAAAVEAKAQQLKPMGIQWNWLSLRGVRVLQLFDSQHTGLGGYVFRLGEAEEVIVQAPHRFHDLGTFEVAARLFEQSNARAFFFNTSHRHQHANADVTHEIDSVFTQMTAEFVNHRPARVIQIHGFADSPDRDVDVILSNGTKNPGSLVALVPRLSGESRVALYGRDIRQLGGTQNAVGRTVRSHGGSFVHVELSRSFRKRLARDSARPLLPLVASSRLPGV